MKIKSGLVTQISGSIGGLTGQQSRGGMVLKAKGSVTQRRSTRQLAAQNKFAHLNQRWVEILTPSQREAWAVYASLVPRVDALGDQRFISAKDQYLRSNILRMTAGLAPVDDGPTEMMLDQPPLIIFSSASATTQSVTTAFSVTMPWANETGAALTMQMANPHNRSASAFRFTFRLMAAVLGVTGSPPPAFLISPAPFPIAINQVYTLITRITRADGRLSYFTRFDGQVGI